MVSRLLLGTGALVDTPFRTIDAFGPLPVVRPASPAELGDLVRRAAADGQALYPVGGGTRLDLGLPPSRPGVAVDVRGLDAVIDYPARDMTITVQAGLTVGRLREVLAAERQRLPIDVPDADRATLGGTVAANVSGPRRLGFGTLRDYVIGISVVNDEGHEARAGGRVVKNVAGYDLCKLHVGALGTLGFVSQLTLKLKPIPEASALVVCGVVGDRLPALLDTLHATRTRPVCLDVLSRPAADAVGRNAGLALPAGPFVVLVGYEEKAETVAWQVEQVRRELADTDARSVEALTDGADALLWRALVEYRREPGVGGTFKANVLPRLVPLFCQQMAVSPQEPALHAHAGSGVVVGHFGPGLTREEVGPMLTAWQQSAGPDGNAIVERCPPTWKADLPVWGRPRGDRSLMRAVKQQLDPRRLFNPGRFLDW